MRHRGNLTYGTCWGRNLLRAERTNREHADTRRQLRVGGNSLKTLKFQDDGDGGRWRALRAYGCRGSRTLDDIHWDLEIMVNFEVCGNTYDKPRED